jgi:hypothetical protein
MKFQHAVRVRPALTALAATVSLGALASPALAHVDRRAAEFRGGYQLQLNAPHKLLGT